MHPLESYYLFLKARNALKQCFGDSNHSVNLPVSLPDPIDDKQCYEMRAVQCLHLIAHGVLRAFSNGRRGNVFVSYTHSSSGIAAHYCQTEAFESP